MAGGFAVDLDGDGGGGVDLDLISLYIDNVFTMQMFAYGCAENVRHHFGAGSAGEDADIKQAIGGGGQRQHREAGAVFGDVADENEGGGRAEDFLAVDGDRERRIVICAECMQNGGEIAEIADRAGAALFEDVDDFGIKADTGDEEKELPVGGGGIEIDGTGGAEGGEDLIF